MNIQSILAVTDLSAEGNFALERAALIAATHGAELQTLYAGQRTSGVARIAARAASADLVVIGHRRERSLAALLHGQIAERLLRECACPVLVTRTMPKSRYRRIVAAIDLKPESQNVARVAWSLDPAAEVDLFHAVSLAHEGKLRYADVSEDILNAYRGRCLEEARSRLLSLSSAFDARRNRVRSIIGIGDPARQAIVQQDFRRADLLVVGKRRRPALADFFMGSVAARVLCWGTGDVMLVRHDYEVPAHEQIKTGRGSAAIRLVAKDVLAPG